jgi:hypothetical protein
MTTENDAFGFSLSFHDDDELKRYEEDLRKKSQIQITEITSTLDAKIQRIKELEAQVLAMQTQLNVDKTRLQNALDLIRPFVNNLTAEPEKLYIKWPDRLNQIKSFQDKLDNIVAS